MRTVVLLSVVVVSWVTSAAAADGVLIVQTITSGTSATTTQVQIEKTRIRTQITDPNGETQILVFDGGQQVLRIISPAKKSYMEMTKAELDRTAAQMQGMMAQMQGVMANLPPAQRAQMEAMMRGRGAGAPEERTEYKRTGSDRAGKWACSKYDGFRGGQKISELCTVEPSVLGLTMDDFAVTRQMVEFFRTLMPQMSDQAVLLGRGEEDGFSGLPVKTSTTIGGRTTTIEITDARRETFAESVFAVPAGFQKQSLGAMGMPARGQ